MARTPRPDIGPGSEVESRRPALENGDRSRSFIERDGDPVDAEASRTQTRRVPRELLAIHLVALVSVFVAAIFVVAPFWPWIVLALWTSGLASGLGPQVIHVVRGRKRAAAAITLALVLAILVPLVLTIMPLTVDGVALVRRVLAAPDARRMLESFVSENASEAAPDVSLSGLTRFFGTHGTRVWQIVRTVAGATTHAMSGAAVFVVTAYVRLAHGHELYAWVERHAPIDARHLARIASAFSETGRGLFIGAGGAALAQSSIATIAYAALGVPHAFVLGVLTFLAALIPGIGTGLVWVPVAAGLALTGRTSAAVVVCVVGLGLVGTIDNVLKPVLARYGRLDLPASVVFVSMLGGLLVVGAGGILLGPIVVRLAKELVVIAREEREAAALRPSNATAP